MRVFIVLLVLIGAAVAFIASRPNTYHIERSIDVSAPAESVFAHVNDLHRWDAWSPWEKLDPHMLRTYEGAESGVGATYHWTGNKDVGEGRMTITESAPGQKVGIRLEFVKPFAATSTATFTFTPEAGSTQVHWAMDGTNNFMAKAMTVFMNMDKMVGADFEKGLTSLKTVSEAAAQQAVQAPVEAPTASAHK